MLNDLVSLCVEYAPGGAVNGESPIGYTVTARDGALTARCPDYPTALRYFHRWAGCPEDADANGTDCPNA